MPLTERVVVKRYPDNPAVDKAADFARYILRLDFKDYQGDDAAFSKELRRRTAEYSVKTDQMLLNEEKQQAVYHNQHEQGLLNALEFKTEINFSERRCAQRKEEEVHCETIFILTDNVVNKMKKWTVTGHINPLNRNA